MANGNGANRVLIPIALLLVSLLANAWLGSALSLRSRDHEAIEENATAIRAVIERLVRVETKVDVIGEDVGEIKADLKDHAEPRGGG